MFCLLTSKLRREYNHLEVLLYTAAPLGRGRRASLIRRIASLMNTYPTEQRKEVTALDADVPLLRSALIRFNVSRLRMFKTQADRLDARHFELIGAG